VWYASSRTKGYLWHVPAAVVGRLVGLRRANVAEGAGPDAHAYLSELLDLQQSLDWEAAGPCLARRVSGEEGEAPRAFIHCEKRLVGGRIGLREGLGDLAYPYAAGVTATSPPPDSGSGAPGVSSPHSRRFCHCASLVTFNPFEGDTVWCPIETAAYDSKWPVGDLATQLYGSDGMSNG